MDQIVYALEARTCVTIATIYSVEVLPKWYYIACKVCNKKVQPYPPESQTGKDLLYSCGVCDADVTDVDYKYKLILHVGYGSSQKIKLLFFDGLAQLFIGKKTEELALEKPKDDIAAIPGTLSVLVGKTMLFKILITINNLKSDKSAYVVEKFWEKDDMVVQFGKKAAPPTSNNASSSDSADKNSDEVSPQSSVQTIYVEGFGSSLPENDIKTALSKHFSACGEITRVFVPTNFETGFFKGFAYIDLKGEATKALELNGSHMIGKELVVKKALLIRDSYTGHSGSDRGSGGHFGNVGGRFGGRFGNVGGRFGGGRCGGYGKCGRC
ncbi:PREDICTED: uncharacterized protein LOC109125939 [Camelina sativa]|uniref:Uncharacterized protein LOC109125939 n=1 Tax=Camelina sativa TaxID=90675 RepID=A0ABM1QC05_CAMSA|nr:PREDICTED: uncharacterized protein LOC109125939 [Camelina sativa]